MFDPKETLQQLTHKPNATNVLSVMIGAKHFGKDDEAQSVSFRFTAKAVNKSNYVIITLDAMDTYTMEFGSIRAHKYTVKSKTEGLYNDMLKHHFESETGLRLNLGF